MSSIVYPSSLKAGDIVGVTAPSSGVSPGLEERLKVCVDAVRAYGYDVQLGECLRSANIVSASAQARAAEFTRMWLDERIRAIVPPWGGELLINMLPHLDFEQLAQAMPKWLVGYSDISTLLMPLTMLTGVATLHGGALMETPFAPDPALKHWHDVATLDAGATFTQGSAARYQEQYRDYREFPDGREWNYSQPAQWKWLGHEKDANVSVTVSGRLIGGCVEVISMLPGTPYGDVERFVHDYAPEGLLVYAEVCEEAAPGAGRMWQHMKLAGWFKHANAVLVGRTAASDGLHYTQFEAMADALGDLGVPVIYDMDIGHLPPQTMLVNGAKAWAHFGPSGNRIEQVLV